MYGVFFESQSGYRVFANGYKCLSFVGAGYTQPFRGLLYSLRFSCPTFPIIYIRSTISGNLTAIHSVVHNGGYNYTLYTLGDAEVFVFTEVIERSDYGLEIYDQNGNVTFNSVSCIPVKPIASVSFPPMAPGEARAWNSGLGARKLAYNLMGNRGFLQIDVQYSTLSVWRDVVQSVSGGFVLISGKLPDTGQANANTFQRELAGFIGSSETPTQPMLMSVIDVHDLNFQGRRDSAFY